MHARHLPIARPCHEDFSAMEGRGASRLCEHCQESVHDLAGMTRAAAQHFLLQHQGQAVCVRYRVRPDGALRFVAPPARRTGPVVVLMAGLMAACTGHLEEAELDSPADALTCEDAAGYTIPCVEPEGGHEPEFTPEGGREPTVEPVGPPEWVEPEGPTGETASTDEDEWAADALIPEAGDDPEGCPIRRWDEGEYGDDVLVMGRMDVPRLSAAQERRIERKYRKETRSERREARREGRVVR